jgi:hypothetical protein
LSLNSWEGFERKKWKRIGKENEGERGGVKGQNIERKAEGRKEAYTKNERWMEEWKRKQVKQV